MKIMHDSVSYAGLAICMHSCMQNSKHLRSKPAWQMVDKISACTVMMCGKMNYLKLHNNFNAFMKFLQHSDMHACTCINLML